MTNRTHIILFLLFFLIANVAEALGNDTTRIYGVVLDAQTGQPLPYVQIYFQGTSIGTLSNEKGQFNLHNQRNSTTAVFRMMGYKTERSTIKARTSQKVTIRLVPEIYEVEEVVIVPKRQRYSRRNNPAVELLDSVLAHKKQNALDTNYVAHTYEKLTMNIMPFDFNLDRNAFRRELKFLEKYVDTLALSQTLHNNQNSTTYPYLPISIREKILQEEYRKTSPFKRQRAYISSKTWAGMDKYFEQGTLDANINALFVPVDVRNNNIELMLADFVSPLSSTQGNAFYHYYIMDTVLLDNTVCIDLGFVPVNSYSLGFSGHIYVVNDSSYAVKACIMQVSSKINLNWINNLRITQRFEQQSNGQWAVGSTLMETSFVLHRWMKHSLYARYQRNTGSFDLGETLADNLFEMQGDVVVADSAEQHKRGYWNEVRPVPITQSEQVCDSLSAEVMRLKSFQAISKTVAIVREGYLPTTPDMTFDSSKFDIGPIFNTVSYNGIEGWRVSVGGMTTAAAHPHIFFETHLAYGFKDKRPKGSVALTYAFNSKKHYVGESPRHNLSLFGGYDVEEQSISFENITRDNIFFSFDPASWVDPSKWNHKAQYVARGGISYEQEWHNGLSFFASAEYEHNEAAGSVRYYFVDPKLKSINSFQTAKLKLHLTYSPNRPLYNSRNEKSKHLTELSKRAPIFGLKNTFGYMIEHDMFYNHTELSAEYRLMMSSFGYIDMCIRGGAVFGFDRKNGNLRGLPFPKLLFARTVAPKGLFIHKNAFNQIEGLEFATDKYVSWHLTYHLNGLILNRIPFVNRLKWREVVSFNGLYGHLSDRNNALLDGCAGDLYKFPTYTHTLSTTMPYMEISVGIENIFRFLRIDYIRRLTYTEGLGPWQRNGIKVALQLTM